MVKWHELEKEQAKDLDYKIEQATRWIIRAFEIAKNPALAFSGGKDSTVLLDLIRKVATERAARMPVILGNTGVEYPESLHFARKLAGDWNLNYHEARPGKTDRPGYKYAGQRRILERLVQDGRIAEVLKPDGKLKGTETLERLCPPDLHDELVKERLVWPDGSTQTYWWCADQYGWPLLGKSWSRLDAHRINIDTFLNHSQSQSEDPKLLAYYAVLKRAKISQHCCTVLKKEPSQRVQASLGSDLIFKGLMASESRTRAKNFLTRGYLFEGAKRDYLNGQPFFHCQPLAVWKDDDIWAYIRRFDVPYSPLYDMKYYSIDGGQRCIRRNGCLGCGTDFGFRDNHLFVLRQTHRSAWRAIMHAGMAQEIRNLQNAMRAGQLTLFDAMDTDELIDAQPCAFDDLDGFGGMPAMQGLVYDADVEI